MTDPSNRLERSLLFGSENNIVGGGQMSSSCGEPSEISENTIIRTKDSRALGARFLNETSLGPDSRDRCLDLCCAFHGCNVAVYEEKDGGNCYLFDCGSADDFRCKFTSHSHYTSGVIRRRDNAHEEELTQLKKFPANAVVISTATPSPVTKSMITFPQPTTVTTSSTTMKPSRTCSRYQFECHTTGECIAIYNACDGIIQCSDGSDEAPELGCPAITTESTTTKRTTAEQLPPIVPIHHNKSPAELGIPAVIPQQQQRPFSSATDWRANRGDRDRFAPDPLPNIPDVNHWRTSPERDRVRAPYQQQQPSAVEESAAVYPGSEPDRSINPYYNPDTGSHRYGSAYGREQDQGTEYRSGPGELYNGDRYNSIYDKEVVRVPVSSSYEERGPIYPSHKQHEHDWERNSIGVISAPGPNSELQQRNPVQVDRSSFIQSPQRIPPPNVMEPQQQLNKNMSPAPEVKVTTTTSLPRPQVVETAATPAMIKNHAAPSLITKDDVGPQHAHINHFHVNQVDFQEERAERSRQTVGAVWALTLGLSVTAVLVLLVGCRLRSLKSRLRRGSGRNGHARDADYLVNGMYL